MKLRTISAAACVVAVSLFGYSPETEAGADPHIGDIQIVASNFCPRGWAPANGQLLPIAQHTALFSILGTSYGGDGRTTFALPNLQGRAAVAEGSGPGLSTFRLGQTAGTETETIQSSNLPSHTHRAGVLSANEDANSTDPRANAFANTVDDTYYSGEAPSGRYMNRNTILADPAGSSTAVNNMQPSLGILHCVALVGAYPSRS